MAAKLESAARNPVLRLLLKSSVVAFSLFWLRQTGLHSGPLFLFLVLFSSVYFRPLFNSRKFLASAIGLIALPILIPPLGAKLNFLFILIWASSFFLLVGIKNLILLRRQGIYETLHLLIIIGVGTLFLIEFIPQILLFLTLFFLFREFYFTLAPHYPQRLTLIAVTESLLLVEAAWILSFMPINFLAGAAFIALTTFIFHDFILHHLKGTLLRQIVLRNTTLFVGLFIILMMLPR